MVQQLKTVVVSDKIVPKNNNQPEMILTKEVLEKSPDVYVNAIHNHYEDGKSRYMNFELSNGYVTEQTGYYITESPDVYVNAIHNYKQDGTSI